MAPKCIQNVVIALKKNIKTGTLLKTKKHFRFFIIIIIILKGIVLDYNNNNYICFLYNAIFANQVWCKTWLAKMALL